MCDDRDIVKQKQAKQTSHIQFKQERHIISCLALKNTFVFINDLWLGACKNRISV